MVKHRSNLFLIRSNDSSAARGGLTQDDYVIFEQWMRTLEGQMALAEAEQLQRRRLASSETKRFARYEPNIAG